MGTLKSFAGGARQTTLSGPITNSDMSFTVTAAGGTGYPTGAGGPFVVSLDMGLAGEEKILCSSRATDTFTVNAGGRGYDGTSAAAHNNGATVDHVLDAVTISEANAHANDVTTDVHPQYLTAAEGNAAYVAKADAAATVIATAETTASTAYTDLATPGPAVTATVGASGEALVLLSAYARNATATKQAIAGFAVSGATTQAATDTKSLQVTSSDADAAFSLSRSVLVTGLTPGSNTFTMKYRCDAGTALFADRSIIVIPF